jgi:hypothetical protein
VTVTTTPSPVSIDTSPAFEHSCVETAVFAAGAERAYAALFDLTQWERLLPHILKIDVAYDDGQYQEFWMTVQSEADGSPLTVRSVRNCTPGVIEFFQPEPPAFLRHHGGIWRFRALGDDATEVQITHVWNLHPEGAAQQFPSDADASTEEKVARTLAGHSRITLETWQSILAGGEA